jgi:hypothetical protein
MATCIDCKREMMLAASCTVTTIVLGGVRYELRPNRRPRSADPTLRCHDCGVRPGGYHHLGCDMLDCPACGRQLISCGCWHDGEEDAEEDDDDDDMIAS